MATATDSPRLKIVETRKIWDKTPHCAFTDLVRWRGDWYCGFREGEGHAGDRGLLRILRSDTGSNWESFAQIGDEAFDFRDAALSVTPDNRLMAIAGSQHTVDEQRSTGTFVSFCEAGAEFTTPERIFPQGRWLWRVTWRDGVGYGVSYSAYADYPIARLVATTDGLNYRTISPEFLTEGWPTEARVRFTGDGTAVCLQRVDRGNRTSLLGTAEQPYQDWTWKDLGEHIGGPNLIQIPTGEWVGCGRLSTDGKSYTEVFAIDAQAGKIARLVRLPSGGDSSYPGMVWCDGELWISYYSSHEGSTAIYLARLAEDKD